MHSFSFPIQSPKKKSLSTPVKPVQKKDSSSESDSSSDEEKTAKGRMSPVIPVVGLVHNMNEWLQLD